MTDIAEFKSALEKGLGRAMILLRQHSDKPAFQAALLHACQVNLAYDRQCERSRAGYLSRLIRETGQNHAYWVDLVRGFGELAEGDTRYDKTQIFETLCMLASHDLSLDRMTLQALMNAASFDDVDGGAMEAFVRLSGIDGLLHCIRRFSAEMDRSEWILPTLLEALAERDGAEAAAASLREFRPGCPALDRLMRAMEADRRPGPPTDTVLDRAMVKASVARDRRIPFPWIRDASLEDLEWAADELLAEDDEGRIWVYLRAFGRRDFPRPPERLFGFVHSHNARIAYSAARALGRIGHPEIRKLALALLADGEAPAIGLHLLRRNLQSGDFATIERVLAMAEADAEAVHRLELAILNLLDATPPEESRETLLKLYEIGQCSLCRETVVSKLLALGSVPGWLMEECRYDADPETAARFGSA